MCSSSPERTAKLKLTVEQPLTIECWITPKKKIAYVQGQRESPNKLVRGVKSHLESNPIPTRDAWRTQMKPCVHQDPEAHRD